VTKCGGLAKSSHFWEERKHLAMLLSMLTDVRHLLKLFKFCIKFIKIGSINTIPINNKIVTRPENTYLHLGGYS
jgi:hypothetical protein